MMVWFLGSRVGFDLVEMGDVFGFELEVMIVVLWFWFFCEVVFEFVVEGLNEMVCNLVMVVVLVVMLCDVGKDVSGCWFFKVVYF